MVSKILFDENGYIIFPRRHKKHKLREKKYLSTKKKGNLAFKCNYNDRGYQDVCSDKIYLYNKSIGKVWCCDPKNRCRDFSKDKLNLEDITSLNPDQFPCYESCIFITYTMGAGVRHRGDKYGEPFIIRNAEVGKLAFLTTREPYADESQRYIFGFLHIRKIDFCDIGKEPISGFRSQYIFGYPETSLKIDNRIKLKFWDYYKNERNPELFHWGTGLFRYLSDETTLKILYALRDEYKRIRGENRDLEIINHHIERYESN